MEENCFESASECKLRLHKNKREEKIFENYINKSDAWFARKVKTCFKDTREFLRQYNNHDKSSYSGDTVYCYYKFVMKSIKFFNTYMTEEEWINFCDKFTEFGINDLLLPDKFPQKNEEFGIITLNNITGLCFYCWVIYEYINANTGLKLNSIQKFVNKCKSDFRTSKSDLKKYFEDRIYKCRKNPKFPLPEANINYCLEKMFEKLEIF